MKGKLKLSDEMREKFRRESPTLQFCDEPGFQLCSQEHFNKIWATVAVPKMLQHIEQKIQLEVAEAKNSEVHAPALAS